MSDFTTTVDGLDRDMLTGPVRHAFGNPSVEIVDWRVQSIHTVLNQSTAGLYRVVGTAQKGDVAGSWSLVLKIAIPVAEGVSVSKDSPDHWNHWKREAHIYASGLLDDLPAIRALRCYGVAYHGDAEAWLWLEDVEGAANPRWPPERYNLAARQLGRFNGAYVTGRPMPEGHFLSRGWRRAAVEAYATHYARLPAVRDHPLVRRGYPPDLLPRSERYWAERHALSDELDRMPRTFCHLDASPRNLLVRKGSGGDADVFAVDWAFSGIGALGEELASMVTSGVLFWGAEPAQVPDLDAAAFAGYLDGLRDAGWRGDPRPIRFAAAVGAALRYGLSPLALWVLDEPTREHLERTFGHPIVDILDRWTEAQRHFFNLADAARKDYQNA